MTRVLVPRRPALVVLALAVALAVLATLIVLLVVPTSPQPEPQARIRETGRILVSDQFDRSQPLGWGNAREGGAWSPATSPDLAVAGGVGTIALPRAGSGSNVTVSPGQAPDLTAAVTVTVPDLTHAGLGIYVSLGLRSDRDYGYRATLRLRGSDAYLTLIRQDGSADRSNVLAPEKLVAKDVRSGQQFRLDLQVTGTTPVLLAASASRGKARPNWQLRSEDAAASRLVAGGELLVGAYLSRKADRGVHIRFDDVHVEGVADPQERRVAGAIGVANPVPGGRITEAGAARAADLHSDVPSNALIVAPDGRAGAAGTVRSPLATLSEAVLRARDGQAVVLRKGTYHESVVLPRGKRISVQAYPREEVWLDGSTRVSAWRRDGDVWIADGWNYTFDASPTYTKGAADDSRPGWRFVSETHPMAAHPDQLWIDGKAQGQVRTREKVTRGGFYVDEARQELVVGTDPTGREVRASSLSVALTVLGDGDVVQGLGVRRYATSVWQMGAVVVYATKVKVKNLRIVDNATTGLSVNGPSATIERVTALRNGMMGVHANRADDLVGVGLDVRGNNTQRFNRAPASGGMKVTTSKGVTVRDSVVSHNLGNGLWCDEGCSDIVLARDDLDHNQGSGLVLELSSRALVVDNRIGYNDIGGALLIDTDRVEVAANSFRGNRENSIRLVTDGRWKTSDGTLPWVTQDVQIYDNVLEQGGAACIVCIEDLSQLLTPSTTAVALDHNQYRRLGSGGAVLVAWPSGAGASSDLVGLERLRAERGQEEHGGDAARLGAGAAVVHGRPVSAPAARAAGWRDRAVRLGSER